MSALFVAILMAAGCKATTNIPEAKAEIHRACRDGLKSVWWMGTHDHARWVYTYDLDLSGHPIAGTEDAVVAWHVAVAAAEILQSIYPMRRLDVELRDRNDSEICRFRFRHGQRRPVLALCIDVVGPPKKIIVETSK